MELLLRVGVVVDNNDPEKRRRCRVRILKVHSDNAPPAELPWALACSSASFGGTATFGQFGVPPVGSKLILLLQGDADNPIYLGLMVDSTNTPAEEKENYPHRFGWVLGSTKFYVDTATDTLKLEHAGHTLTLSGDGVTLDCASNLTATVAGQCSITAATISLN